MLALWVRGDINLDLFSRADGFVVSEGIFATGAKPANRVRVNAVIVDLHYNVPDSEVCRYFEAFGAKVANKEATYGRYRKGAFNGKINNERNFKIDPSGLKCEMGTYHVIASVQSSWLCFRYINLDIS